MNNPLPFVMLLAVACMAAPVVLVPVGLLVLAVRRMSERTAALRELAFRIDDGPPPDLESLRLDARASVYLTSAVNGWLVVARPGSMPPQRLRAFLDDAVRILGIALREAVPASSLVNLVHRRIP